MIKPLTLSLMAAAALQLASTASVAQVSAAATTAGSYYVITHADMRKCAYPMCGGYFVKAVNQLLTRCADGSWQKECHAVELNTAALGWSDDQRAAFDDTFSQGKALVRGQLGVGSLQSIKADVLCVSEAWQAQALSKPAGTFYAVKSTGIVCITAPCPSLAATKLNSVAQPTNPDLDLSATGASDDQIQAAYNALSGTGVLAVGAIVPIRYPSLNGSTRKGSKLIATEFYLPAKP
jgi:hypothetical protein